MKESSSVVIKGAITHAENSDNYESVGIVLDEKDAFWLRELAEAAGVSPETFAENIVSTFLRNEVYSTSHVAEAMA